MAQSSNDDAAFRVARFAWRDPDGFPHSTVSLCGDFDGGGWRGGR